tara:strand:+ start:3618 stop:3833 length:216 start_codon:yes stop_codon:yes gene_type:complete
MNNKQINPDYLTKNKQILLKLNENIMSLTNIINEHNSKLNRLTSDLEVIKSYINQQEQIKKEISRGWFFSY